MTQPSGTQSNRIGVCVKWVDARPEVDGSGILVADERFSGFSPADEAALEWALRCRDRWQQQVTVVCVGPSAADAALHNALAVGASRAVRVDADQLPSPAVAQALATHLANANIIFCGDYSLDRGTGSVPAMLAARLQIGQALGLVHVEIGEANQLGALRRLDGGRRERLAISRRAVLSVEGSTATLRRASTRALVAAAQIDRPTIEVVTSTASPSNPPPTPVQTRPYHPRARALAAPVGESALQRVISLTDAGAVASSGETVVLDPAQAATRIIVALRDWGYAD